MMNRILQKYAISKQNWTVAHATEGSDAKTLTFILNVDLRSPLSCHYLVIKCTVQTSVYD